MIGEVVGSYRVTGKLGEGGMGAVYSAEHTLLGKKAAVKVLHAQLSLDPEFVSRFFNEARATTLIRHPGLVEVFDFGHLPSGAAFIVMEFLDGESLAARLERGTLPTTTLIEIVRQLASALGAAHAGGIVHRDLKPENLFLVPDADRRCGVRVKVLDFGIAKLSESDSPAGGHKTRTGALMGTPMYMSPEQCRGAGRVDHRSDIYSLGCIVFEMVTGHPPFRGEGPGEVIAAHLYAPAPTLRSLVPTASEGLERMVARMLSKRPDDRYAGLGEVAVELAALEPSRNDVGMEFDDTRQNPIADAASPVAASVGPEMRNTTLSRSAAEVVLDRPRRRGWRIGAVFGGLVAVCVGGSLAITARRHAAASMTSLPVGAPTVEAPSPIDVPRPAAARTQARLAIDSQPSGAEVYRLADGQLAGRTPFVEETAAGDTPALFVLKLAGYNDARVTLPTNHDGHVTVTLVRHEHRPGTAKDPRKTPPKTLPEATPARTPTTVIDPFDK